MLRPVCPSKLLWASVTLLLLPWYTWTYSSVEDSPGAPQLESVKLSEKELRLEVVRAQQSLKDMHGEVQKDDKDNRRSLSHLEKQGRRIGNMLNSLEASQRDNHDTVMKTVRKLEDTQHKLKAATATLSVLTKQHYSDKRGIEDFRIQVRQRFANALSKETLRIRKKIGLFIRQVHQLNVAATNSSLAFDNFASEVVLQNVTDSIAKVRTIQHYMSSVQSLLDNDRSELRHQARKSDVESIFMRRINFLERMKSQVEEEKSDVEEKKSMSCGLKEDKTCAFSRLTEAVSRISARIDTLQEWITDAERAGAQEETRLKSYEAIVEHMLQETTAPISKKSMASAAKNLDKVEPPRNQDRPEEKEHLASKPQAIHIDCKVELCE